jgi:NADH dehydrogenase/NADH:ubiquinone oxidoreductase subunit G
VDLCPVGALTHRRWRFNTRIWYTKEVDSICTGCSTGCNVKVAVRDGRIVQVKARLNSEVNKEWLCDEGRYGFERFQTSPRLVTPMLWQGETFNEISWEESYKYSKGLIGSDSSDAAVFLSPMLTFEEIWTALRFAEEVMGVTASSNHIAMQLQLRELSSVEAVLVSPDIAPNARSASYFGITSITPGSSNWRESLQLGYESLISLVRQNKIKRILFVGDYSLLSKDLDQDLIQAINECETSVCLTTRGFVKNGSLVSRGKGYCNLLYPSRTVNEKNGVMINKDARMQRLRALLDPPSGDIARVGYLEANRRIIRKANYTKRKSMTTEHFLGI